MVELYIQLQACNFLDETVPYATEQDLEDILRTFPVDIQIISDEYKEKNFRGRTYS